LPESKTTGDSFLARLLRAFEVVLLDGEEGLASLRQQIEKIPLLFDAAGTPEEFLSWLAAWVAFDLRAELPVSNKRKLVAEIASLYRIRGTRAYLERILGLTLDASPLVVDTELPGLQIAKHSTIGENTYLGGGPPFLFQVILAFSSHDSHFVESQLRLARDVIDREKPAHTWYELKATFPREGTHPAEGGDTVLVPQ
jgi:phage tail-like protein